jgi:hypothetical protein
MQRKKVWEGGLDCGWKAKGYTWLLGLSFLLANVVHNVDGLTAFNPGEASAPDRSA